jgi:hypothetical protein
MPADLTKCRNAYNYREGSAVTVQPVIASPSSKILSVAHGRTNKSWSDYILVLSHKWKYPLYYTEGAPILGTTSDVATSSTNAAAVVTYAADYYGRHSIEGVAWSYDATPTGGLLTIENASGNVVFSGSITAAGPGFFNFEEGLLGSINSAMIITLAAGGSGVVGKINVVGHKVI